MKSSTVSAANVFVEIVSSANHKDAVVEAESFAQLELNAIRTEYTFEKKGATVVIYFTETTNVRDIQVKIIEHIAESGMDPDVLFFKLN